MIDLTKHELNRYRRHITMPEVGTAGQKRLKAARVLIIGAGGLGTPCLLYLAAAGVGTLGIADFDAVDLSNLQRQILYSENNVGESKVSAAAARLSGMNSDILIRTHETRIAASNIREIIEQYDVVIDGSDNFSTRYLVNDACVMMKKPNVYGSIYRFEGQVSLFVPGKGPCYRCLFPEPPTADAIPNCAQAGVFGVIAGVIGTLQAVESVKWVLGIGQSLLGRVMLYDALSAEFNTVTLTRNKHCPACGDIPSIIELREENIACQNSTAPADCFSEITHEQLQILTEQQPNLFLLDVRSRDEFEMMKLPGAVLIPLDELSSRLDEVPSGDNIVVYCFSGYRSKKAAALLRSNGYKSVYSLIGGIQTRADLLR